MRQHDTMALRLRLVIGKSPQTAPTPRKLARPGVIRNTSTHGSVVLQKNQERQQSPPKGHALTTASCTSARKKKVTKTAMERLTVATHRARRPSQSALAEIVPGMRCAT